MRRRTHGSHPPRRPMSASRARRPSSKKAPSKAVAAKTSPPGPGSTPMGRALHGRPAGSPAQAGAAVVVRGVDAFALRRITNMVRSVADGIARRRCSLLPCCCGLRAGPPELARHLRKGDRLPEARRDGDGRGPSRERLVVDGLLPWSAFPVSRTGQPNHVQPCCRWAWARLGRPAASPSTGGAVKRDLPLLLLSSPPAEVADPGARLHVTGPSCSRGRARPSVEATRFRRRCWSASSCATQVPATFSRTLDRVIGMLVRVT